MIPPKSLMAMCLLTTNSYLVHLRTLLLIKGKRDYQLANTHKDTSKLENRIPCLRKESHTYFHSRHANSSFPN